MNCPICDHEMTTSEPEEGIVVLHCYRCNHEEEREVNDGYWF